MSVQLATLIEAIRDDLASATGVKLSTGYDTLTEGINEWPLVQVLPDSGETAHRSGTERTTFGAVLREERVVIHVDVYARQRSNAADDMAAVVDAADAIKARLELQTTTPPFGVAGVDAWHWSWQYVSFVYGEAPVSYMGIRFRLTFISHN